MEMIIDEDGDPAIRFTGREAEILTEIMGAFEVKDEDENGDG